MAAKWGSEILDLNPLLLKQLNSLIRIAAISKELMTSMHARMLKWNSGEILTKSVGDLLLGFIPRMKQEYQSYINDYDVMIDIIRGLEENNSEFAAHVQRFTPSGMGFHLILPIQRIPRYELLVSSLIKFTPESHPDFETLHVIHKKIKKLLQFLNETKRREDNQRKVLEVLSLLSAPKNRKLPEILEAQGMKKRTFVREGLLYEASTKNERYVFMFDEFLIKTKPKNANWLASNFNRLSSKAAQSYEYRDIIPFSRVFLSSSHDEEGESFNVTFKLIQRDPPPGLSPLVETFMCSSEDECKSWMKDINEAINLTHVMAQIGSSS